MNCDLHNVMMQEKNGEYGPYYSHIIPDVGFCNGKKITPFKPKTELATAVPVPGLSQGENAIGKMVEVNRSQRIERQHSQDMALRYFQAKGIKDFTDEQLVQQTNFFVKDLDN